MVGIEPLLKGRRHPTGGKAVEQSPLARARLSGWAVKQADVGQDILRLCGKGDVIPIPVAEGDQVVASPASLRDGAPGGEFTSHVQVPAALLVSNRGPLTLSDVPNDQTARGFGNEQSVK